MSSPLVSILMTAYNREKYIAEAIESVLASTYTNLELIVVDDCSTDHTVSVAKKYEAQDRRVKVYVNEKNLGDYPNRNRAASYAKGKYIKYIDADDAIYYWGLQVVVEMMERFPEAGYGLDSITQDDERIYPYLLNPSEAYYAYYIKRNGIFDAAPTSCTIKREVFIEVDGFKAIKMIGDCELWHRLSVSYPVLVMPHGIIWSRGHEHSQSGLYKKDIATVYHYLFIKRLFVLDDQCPLPPSKNRLGILKITGSQIKIVMKCLLQLNLKALKRISAMENRNTWRLLFLHLQLKRQN